MTRLVTEEELHDFHESTASGTSLLETLDAELVEADGGGQVFVVAPPDADTRYPWERQHGETARSYHAFCHFRDLKIRSASVAYRTHKRECEKAPVPEHTLAPHHWRIWSSQWGWVERSTLWDAEIDRQHREKVVQAQLEARDRHARLAQATLTVLSLPVKAALEAARDPALVQKMIDAAGQGPAGSYQLLSTIARMAAVMPSVVTMERLALGLTTESVEVENKRDFDVAFANRIVADQIATDLAIQLLSRVAGPGPHPALGPGASGEPGEVVADATSRPPDEEAG